MKCGEIFLRKSCLLLHAVQLLNRPLHNLNSTRNLTSFIVSSMLSIIKKNNKQEQKGENILQCIQVKLKVRKEMNYMRDFKQIRK